MTHDDKKAIYLKASEVFKSRCEAQGKKKGLTAYKDAEAEFYSGVTATLDIIIGDTENSSIIPQVFFAIMRGDDVYDALHGIRTVSLIEQLELLLERLPEGEVVQLRDHHNEWFGGIWDGQENDTIKTLQKDGTYEIMLSQDGRDGVADESNIWDSNSPEHLDSMIQCTESQIERLERAF